MPTAGGGILEGANSEADYAAAALRRVVGQKQTKHVSISVMKPITVKSCTKLDIGCRCR